MDINQTIEACTAALHLHQSIDYNQTVAAIKEAVQVKDFSRFSSLLEVAFALNVSYHIIPNMYNLGKKSIDRLEAKKVKEWELKISDAQDNEELKTKYKTFIDSIKSKSDDTSVYEKNSRIFSSIALYAAVVSMVLLFLGSLGIGCMNSVSPLIRDITQTSIVIILLMPNVVALLLQLKHWKEIKKELNIVIDALERTIG